MKIPALLMASLLAVGVSAQTTKPEAKTKKPVKKVKKATSTDTVEKKKPGTPNRLLKKIHLYFVDMAVRLVEWDRK